MKQMRQIKRLVNVFGVTNYYLNGELEYTKDGFGYKDEKGNITWYDGYSQEPDNDFHLSFIYPCNIELHIPFEDGEK